MPKLKQNRKGFVPCTEHKEALWLGGLWEIGGVAGGFGGCGGWEIPTC